MGYIDRTAAHPVLGSPQLPPLPPYLIDQIKLTAEFPVTAAWRLVLGLQQVGAIRRIWPLKSGQKATGSFRLRGVPIHLSPAPKFINVYLRYWGHSADINRADGWHIEFTIEPQLLLRWTLARHGECDDVSDVTPPHDRNVLPHEYLDRLEPWERVRLLQLQVMLINEAVSEAIEILNHMIEDADARRTLPDPGRVGMTLYDPIVSLASVELARDIPTARVPGGINRLFRAATVTLPILRRNKKLALRHHRHGRLSFGVWLKLYEKLTAGVIRLETAFWKKGLEHALEDRSWDLTSTDAGISKLNYLANRVIHHWRRLLTTASLDSVRPHDVDLKSLEKEFAHESLSTLRWLVRRLWSGPIPAPDQDTDALLAHIAGRLHREFWIVRRLRRQKARAVIVLDRARLLDEATATTTPAAP